MQLRMLVFPAPLGPMTATISPSLTSKLTPERAETPPKFKQISFAFNLTEMFLSFSRGEVKRPSSYKIELPDVNRKNVNRKN
jgi:hypothetical protein